MQPDNTSRNGNEPFTNLWLKLQPVGRLKAILALQEGTPNQRRLVRAELTLRSLAEQAAERARTGQPGHAQPKTKRRGKREQAGDEDSGRSKGRSRGRHVKKRPRRDDKGGN